MDLNDLNMLKPNEFRTQNINTSAVNLQPAPPPIPNRPNLRTFGYSAPMHNPLFGSYGNSAAYFNGYNNYSSFNSPYNSFMSNNNPANSFLRVAEDNSRYAFQSIESVVHAFTAVSMMFESTFHAVYNSFRAVVGVADQFYRLKTHLSNILSAFAVLKALKYLARKLLRILRLKKFDKNEEIWTRGMNSSDAENLVKNNKHYTNWPLILFFAVVVGGPWLIWRILSSIESIHKNDTLWMQGNIDHFIAVSEHDFDAENNDELSFKRGQKIIIAPKEYQPKMKGWLLATIDGKTSGIVPANYLKVLGRKVVQSQNNQQIENYSSLQMKTNIKDSNANIGNSMEQVFDECVNA